MGTDLSKTIRIDVIIAVCALVASSLAAGAAVYQGHVIANQLSVTVWPYITFRESSSNTAIEVDVQNVGAGPAVIGSATLYVDDKPQMSLSSALQTLGLQHSHGSTVTLTNLSPGAVIRAGDSVQLVRVESPQFAALAASVEKRVRIDVCYCSMLQQCWRKVTGQDYPTPSGPCSPAGIISIQT